MDGGSKKASLPKICHTYPTMMKLDTVIPYLKRSKNIYESRHTPLGSAGISNFSPEIKFFYIKKYMYKLHFNTLFLTLVTFLGFLKVTSATKLFFVIKNA